MRELRPDLAGKLCDQVDWARPELAATPFAEAYRTGDFSAAALGLVRHLRERERPLMGYSPQYVAQLREKATPEFCQAARQQVAEVLRGGFMGADWPDGRGALLGARPEVLQTGATAEDFSTYARSVAEAREEWPTTKIHSLATALRYLQAVWPLGECSDEAVLPILAFMVARLRQEWEWARTWGEIMLGPQGHNWFACQYGATWKAGLLFPEFRGFARFPAFFPTYFEREIRLLLFPDGFTHEASVAYHAGTMDLFLDCVRLAELNGLCFSREFYDRLRAGYEVEWKLMCPDGGHPPFGDCWARGPYFLSRARSVAALLQIPEAKHLAEVLDPEWQSPFGPMLIENLHYPSVGEDLRRAYQALQARPPSTLDTALLDSGYFVMRENWTAQADYAALEASAKGNVVTSHGHGAVFDLILYAKGRQITVGNAKGPDGVDDPERTWRHQTMSHTVAVVDGEHHLPLRSIYRFAGVVLPTVDEWLSCPEFAYFSGAHEAYERLPKKVGCRRKLFYLRGQYWILIDRFTTAQPDDEHTYPQRFQMGVPTRILEEGRVITDGEGGNLLFVPLAGARGEPAVAPCPYPLPGDYANPDQLTFTHTQAGNMLFVTVLVPFLGKQPPAVTARLLPVSGDERVLDPWEVTGLEIVVDGRRDVYVDTHMHWSLPWACGGYEGSERLFHSQVPVGEA